MVEVTLHCGSCGALLPWGPGSVWFEQFDEEPGLVAAHITCEADDCPIPRNSVAMPGMADTARREGFWVVHTDRYAPPYVWAGARAASSAVSGIGRMRTGGTDSGLGPVLLGVRPFAADQAGSRGVIARWAAGLDVAQIEREFAA